MIRTGSLSQKSPNDQLSSDRTIQDQTKLQNKGRDARNLNQITRVQAETAGDSYRTKYKEKQKGGPIKMQNSVSS